MSDLSSEVQKEVARLREMITKSKALLPKGQANFVFYEMIIDTAEKAIREQDAVALCIILPRLQKLD